MKQKLIIFVVFVLMALVLIGLNAASYTQKQTDPDSELRPNRSTYNNGPTGTSALYSLLSETGRKVVRWQEPTDALETKRKNAPAVFVVVGPIRRDFKEPEIGGLLRWVSGGGRLVIIDREPTKELATTTANWKIDFKQQNLLALISADPSDQKQMTAEMPAAKPGQPSLFNFNVNAVQPSRFASSIVFEPAVPSSGMGSGKSGPPPKPAPKATIEPDYGSDTGDDEDDPPPPPARKETVDTGKKAVTQPTPVKEMRLDRVDEVPPPARQAPVTHISANGKAILVDVPYGAGRIVYLSDPFIVSNGGISMVDNAQLAVNMVSARDAVIAFDEYHQGYGGNNNRFLEFFAGTPVVAIFIQCAVLIGLLFVSQSRRFGRPLPANEPDRLSKLEYIGAMAELQQRTRAYDLAIENIYRDFRRRAGRLLGVDSMRVSRGEFASRIAERAKKGRDEIEDLMYKCDEIIAGEPTGKKEAVELTARIREVEHALGLRKRPVQ